MRCSFLGVKDNGVEADNEYEKWNANNGHNKAPWTMRTVNVSSNKGEISASSNIRCLHTQYLIVHLSATHTADAKLGTDGLCFH